MSLLDRILSMPKEGEKLPEPQLPNTRLPEEKDLWVLKKWESDDSPEVRLFRKNLAPRIAPCHPAYQYLAYLTFHYPAKDASGLPRLQDQDTLTDIEVSGLGDLLSDGLAVHVAVVTGKGIRDLLFYTRDPHEFLRRASLIRGLYPEYSVECELMPDPDWSQYRDFP